MRKSAACAVGALLLATPLVAACGSSPSGPVLTRQEVAEAIKLSYSDWNAVVAGADNCRLLWADQAADLTDQLNAETCYIDEQTIGISADTALSMLGAGSAPRNLQSLVASTKRVLSEIKGSDIKKACGGDQLPDTSAVACQAVIAKRAAEYAELGPILVQWAPILGLQPDNSSSPGAIPAPSESQAATSELTVSQSNAIDSAQNYLDTGGYSRSGLIQQLEHDGFSATDATYGATHADANWNDQAAQDAQNYQDAHLGYSRSGMIQQLEHDGFTPTQAAYGAAQVGLK